jgi:hypothetical protein
MMHLLSTRARRRGGRFVCYKEASMSLHQCHFVPELKYGRIITSGGCLAETRKVILRKYDAGMLEKSRRGWGENHFRVVPVRAPWLIATEM